ncbi:MAG: hypothetical protein WD061_03545 [Candidatus Saccharimonadales bacterium]
MSKLKVASIQHPGANSSSIELYSDGSISVNKVSSGDIAFTPTDDIADDDVQRALEELGTNKAAKTALNEVQIMHAMETN